MTVQYGRVAHLVVGTAGNPGQIGSPATTTTTTSANYGKALRTNVPADDAAINAPGGTDVAVKNPDGTYNVYAGDGGIPVVGNTTTTTTTSATPNVPATPGSGLDLSQLRFTFQVSQATQQTPGTLDCTIYNLSDATAQKIVKEFTRVQLTAGYQGNSGLIFDGTLSLVRKGRESPTDTVLHLTAVDADQAHQFAVVNTTVAAGNTPEQRLAALQAALTPYGVSAGYTPALTGNTLPRGRVYFGMARDHLRDFAASTGTDWSIQQSKLQLVPQDAYAPGDVIEINSRTGMVGLPEQTFQGVVFRCLLNPSIKPGRAIKLNNDSIQKAALSQAYGAAAQKGFLPNINADGVYRVLLVGHSGDSRGNDWTTTVTCTSNGEIPNALTQTLTTPS